MALLSRVLLSAKTGKLSVLSLSEFWSVKGTAGVVCWVSEVSNGVWALSVFVLSESLEQFAASRVIKVSRQMGRKFTGGILLMGDKLSSAVGCSWGVFVFWAKRFRCFLVARPVGFQRLERGRRGGFGFAKGFCLGFLI